MKRVVILCVLISIVFSFTACVEKYKNAADYCRDNWEDMEYDSVQDCIKNINKEIVMYCMESYEMDGFKNIGECVSYWHSGKWYGDIIE